MTRRNYTVLDILSLCLTLLSFLAFCIFWFTLWLSLPLLGFLMLFLVSRSGHISDREYEATLGHLLAFNTVREARSDGYETLLKFHEQGYLQKTTLTDYYLKGYDLGKGLTRVGEDREARSTVYRLTHLHFTPTHCLYHTCEADLVSLTVTEDRRIVPLDEGAQLQTLPVLLGHRTHRARYLALPYCAPIPVGEENDELDEILAHFTTPAT